MRHAASSVSGIVTGSRLAMRRPTGTSYWIDTPRSPRSALQSQCAYWIAIGRSSPIASRSRAAASGLPSLPTTMSAGARRTTRPTPNTKRETNNRAALHRLAANRLEPARVEIGLERLLPHLLGEKAGDVVSPTLRQMVGPPKVLFGLLQPAPALLKRASSQRGAPPRAAPGAGTADPSSPRTRPGYSRSRPYQRPRQGASRVTLTARGAPCRFSTRRAHRDP